MYIFFGVFLIILFAAHWAVYMTAKRFFGVESRLMVWKLRIILAFLLLSLVLSFILASRYFNIFVRLYYTFSMVWLGLLYFLILASLLAWLIYFSSEIFHFSVSPKILARILFSLAGLLALFGIVNANMVRVKKITLDLPNLPAQWQNKKAVWVSDTHLGHVRNLNFAQKIADLIRKEEPDIVFIGGDLYDGAKVDLDKAIEPLAGLLVKDGVYFITGNHEQYSDSEAHKDAVRRAGIRVLDNELIEIDGLQIAGVDYAGTSGAGSFGAILDGMKLDDKKPSILLKHTPLNLDLAQKKGFSAQISGHSHQGQVFLFKYITRQVYNGYDYGLKNFGDMQVYTSSGAGTWGPPMRVDTKPEIVVVEFY